MTNERAINTEQLAAVFFAVQELTLFLNTHPNDTEATALLDEYNSVLARCSQKYQNQYGPLTIYNQSDLPYCERIAGPWPWELN